MSANFYLFGRVVHHPLLKILAVVISLCLLVIFLALSPILAPLHYHLRRRGRNGFWFDNRLCVGRESFRRRDGRPDA